MDTALHQQNALHHYERNGERVCAFNSNVISSTIPTINKVLYAMFGSLEREERGGKWLPIPLVWMF